MAKVVVVGTCNPHLHLTTSSLLTLLTTPRSLSGVKGEKEGKSRNATHTKLTRQHARTYILGISVKRHVTVL
jgi:hypothetical protein